MIQQLVVNGCSYMEMYASGQGHKDLAQQLNIPVATSLAIGGSANSRIIRSTLKHSYQTTVPTFYLLGMTFLSRLEWPILYQDPTREFEGVWTNPQNQQFRSQWMPHWSEHDTEQWIELKLKSEMYSIVDRLEDLMYRMLSLQASLESRGHRVLMYQQADNIYQEYLNEPRLALFKNNPGIKDGFEWRSIAWQHMHEVAKVTYPEGNQYVPPDMTHPMPGHHLMINTHLTHYIKQSKILA
jgi:hypothetical protein